MKRTSVQIDPHFKEILERLRHEFCIKEKTNVSFREFTKILYENKVFEKLLEQIENGELRNK